MPDGPREPFRADVHVEPRPQAPFGFSLERTSGLTAAEVDSLNRALLRLMAAGLTEFEGMTAIDAAVRVWLEPADAADADLERLMSP